MSVKSTLRLLVKPSVAAARQWLARLGFLMALKPFPNWASRSAGLWLALDGFGSDPAKLWHQNGNLCRYPWFHPIHGWDTVKPACHHCLHIGLALPGKEIFRGNSRGHFLRRAAPCSIRNFLRALGRNLVLMCLCLWFTPFQMINILRAKICPHIHVLAPSVHHVAVR
jgi:hypothetical protein